MIELVIKQMGPVRGHPSNHPTPLLTLPFWMWTLRHTMQNPFIRDFTTRTPVPLKIQIFNIQNIQKFWDFTRTEKLSVIFEFSENGTGIQWIWRIQGTWLITKTWICVADTILVFDTRCGRFEPFYCNDKYFCGGIRLIRWKHIGKLK